MRSVRWVMISPAFTSSSSKILEIIFFWSESREPGSATSSTRSSSSSGLRSPSRFLAPKSQLRVLPNPLRPSGSIYFHPFSAVSAQCCHTAKAPGTPGCILFYCKRFWGGCQFEGMQKGGPRRDRRKKRIRDYPGKIVPVQWRCTGSRRASYGRRGP